MGQNSQAETSFSSHLFGKCFSQLTTQLVKIHDMILHSFKEEDISTIHNLIVVTLQLSQSLYGEGNTLSLLKCKMDNNKRSSSSACEG
jgi:hypothetical protein